MDLRSGLTYIALSCLKYLGKIARSILYTPKAPRQRANLVHTQAPVPSMTDDVLRSPNSTRLWSDVCVQDSGVPEDRQVWFCDHPRSENNVDWGGSEAST